MRVDMEFLFECSSSERVRHQVEHEKRNSISTNSCALFCLLYKHTNDDFFDDFPKISEHVPKISEDSPKVVRRPDNRFRTFSGGKFSKILSKIFEEEPMMFPSYRSISNYFSRDYTIAMVIFSLFKIISYFHV